VGLSVSKIFSFFFFSLAELVDYKTFVSQCFDDSFKTATFDSDESVVRAKREFDDKLLEKAESIADPADLARLYHEAHLFWSNKLIEEIRTNRKEMREEFEKLTGKVEEESNKVNETVKVVLEEFFFSDFLNLFWKMCGGKNRTGEKTLAYLISNQSPLACVTLFLTGLFGWFDARIASRLAKHFGFKLSPYNKVTLIYNLFI